MKNAKVLKPLLLSAAAVMLVVATMFATMAYLTSSAAVSNVFTIGNVKLHMYETKVNPDGTPAEVVEDGAMKSADTNSYHLQPGVTYQKDPTVYVDATSDKSYLFVRLRNDLKTIEKGGAETPTIVEQMRAKGWLEIERAESNVDAVFVYVGTDAATIAAIQAIFSTVDGTTYDSYVDRADAILDAAETAGIKAKIVGGSGVREDIDVFEEFTLKTEIEGLERFGGARIAIVAYAVQANGIGADNNHAVGSRGAFLEAWEYVKTELPFVS